MTMKYGRKARTFDPRIPKMSTLRAGQTLPPLPASVNYAANMPTNLGAMLNDMIGDCVEAAVGHAIQVFTFNADGAANMVTPSDAAIELFYEQAGNYVPGDPSTDNGTIVQVALTDWSNGTVDANQLAAFVEIDQMDMPNVQRSIWESGLVLIGLTVPAYLQNLEAPGSVWDLDPTADNTIVAGHAVIAVGYDASGNIPIQSWGYWYTMTPAFFAKFVDESYALANAAWIKATGLSPAGLTLAQIDALVATMKWAPAWSHRQKRHRRQHRRHKKSVLSVQGGVVGWQEILAK